MTQALDAFPPTLNAAQDRLKKFVPFAASAYAQRRNFDNGPQSRENVSVLSPYLRAKLLDEGQVTRAILAHHTPQEADKFLTEVFWRTYWKGWMELRPAVWDEYLRDLGHLHDDVQTQSGLRQRWETACMGSTGIAPFDDWAQELARTGYLHNHARMWFASIWIFTLGLPWQLGADFFLRHLLDGDAAVNTLSWRWVAGIQTRGKTYLATADNIARFTGGRYRDVPGLAQTAPAIEAPEPPTAGIILPAPPLPLEKPYGIVLHGDDVDVQRLLAHAPGPAALAYLETTAAHSPWHMAPHVEAFRQQAAAAVTGAENLTILPNVQALADWAAEHGLAQIVTPYAPVGPVRTAFCAYQAIGGAPVLSQHRRALDDLAWPLATKGFFPFRKHIPKLIDACRTAETEVSS